MVAASSSETSKTNMLHGTEPTRLSLQHQPPPKPETYLADKLHGVTWLILGGCVKIEAAINKYNLLRFILMVQLSSEGFRNYGTALHSTHFTLPAPAQCFSTKSTNTTSNFGHPKCPNQCCIAVSW